MNITGEIHRTDPSKSELEELYRRTKNELSMLSEITNAMMQSLELDQVLYTILRALTSIEGLAFDRAMFFLVNDEGTALEGKMALGSRSPSRDKQTNTNKETVPFDLNNVLKSYSRFKRDPESRLNSIVKGINIPLSEEMGILALSVLEGIPLEINTEEARSMVNPDLKRLLNMEDFVTVPLKTRDRVLGTVVVDNIFSGNPPTQDNLRILSMFAGHAAMAIENSRLYERIVHLSHTDWLTGLWNTRYFNGVLDESIDRAREESSPISLLMIDIDNFKRFNDTMGHQTGDMAIRKIARLLDRYSRRNDPVCRYGGEEFSVIMSRTDKEEARIIAERLRSEVQKTCNSDDGSESAIPLTISLGIATFPYDAEDKEGLVKLADTALYYAKETGKNRACPYSPGMGSVLDPNE